MRDAFIKQAAEYCAAAGLRLRQLSKRAVDDQTLFERLQDTGRVTVAQIERVQAYMAAHPVDASAPDQPPPPETLNSDAA